MKILLLEDDLFICNQLKDYFALSGHLLDFYLDGRSLLDNAILQNYDIFLFDINTPKLNGFQILELIRKEKIHTPVIYITAQSDIEHIKEGYALGCSDYVKKPFILEELELRINKILYQEHNAQEVSISPNYYFNLSSMTLYYQGKAVDLKQQEKTLLYILIKNIGTIISHDVIKDYVWEDRDICDNTLRTQIKKIREKLVENFIINIRNTGYKIEKYD
jgi:DNA-binding response OmpR family regulator